MSPVRRGRDGSAASSRGRVVVDFAGGQIGGAGRLREQYANYRAGTGGPAHTVLGLAGRVTPSWLVRREVLAGRCDRAVSMNNVGFVLAGREKWLLLHNANHFLTDAESARTYPVLERSFPLKVAQVRRAALRADTVIVPSSAMADRVVAALPSLARRVVVRFNPLATTVARTGRPGPCATIVCPIVPSPYKDLDEHLAELAAALPPHGVRVVCTTDPRSVPAGLRSDPRFSFCGRLSRASVEARYESAAALFFPTAVESFGYPLAEARALGIPVVGQDTPHNREIAAGALVGYRRGDGDSLSAAVDRAVRSSVAADPGPFRPEAYFDWLLTGR